MATPVCSDRISKATVKGDGNGRPIRVERAACALRETNHSCAYIAHEAGFCDQSHMNRTFRRSLGAAIRAER